MINKIIIYIVLGIFGIIRQKDFRLTTKLVFLTDYIRLLTMLALSIIFKFQYRSVYVRAFHLKIYFDSLYTFFYVFNEIFCMAVYPVVRHVRLYYDVGANIGLSILWQKLFNPDLSVIAFEPNATNRRYLKKNLQVNKIKNVVIHPTCLYNKKGVAKFYLINDLIQSLNSGLVLNRDLPYKIIRVRTDRLSRFINQPVSLIKMDVEGAEYDILTDLLTTKKIRLIDKIIYEAHFYNPDQKIGYKKTLDRLKKLGTVTSKVNSEYTRANYFKNSNGLSSDPAALISK